MSIIDTEHCYFPLYNYIHKSVLPNFVGNLKNPKQLEFKYLKIGTQYVARPTLISRLNVNAVDMKNLYEFV